MAEPESLTQEQIREYHDRGFLGPFDLLSESEVREYKLKIAKELKRLDGDFENLEAVNPLALRHLDSSAVYDLCTEEKIVQQMTDIYGQNLLLWDSKLFYKRPQMPEIPWHQHYHHMATSPKVSVTAWIALEDCTEENGCLEFIPGSNDRPFPEVSAPDRMKNSKMTDPEYVDEDEAITMEMEAGQYVLFSETTLHRSSVNETDDVRRAVASRAVPPYVRVQPDVIGDDPDVENHSAVLISGEDDHELNELVEPKHSSR